MLILASNSPRRRQLLGLTGWTFDSIAADIDEQPLPGEDPQAYVLRLAEEKAHCILAGLTGVVQEGAVVAADTTVVMDGEILGKPRDAAEAEQMLRQLRGRLHQVYSGLVVLGLQNQPIRSAVIATEVHMRAYRDDEILAYVASGDPLDKAGAYAIQHREFHPVDSLNGCYANVIGLPLCHLARMLTEILPAPEVPPQAACAGATGEVCTIYGQI
jgi:MAF protein